MPVPGSPRETDQTFPGQPAIDATTERLIAALLAIDPAQAARVRARTAARRRSGLRQGPSADFGDDTPPD